MNIPRSKKLVQTKLSFVKSCKKRKMNQEEKIDDFEELYLEPSDKAFKAEECGRHANSPYFTPKSNDRAVADKNMSTNMSGGKKETQLSQSMPDMGPSTSTQNCHNSPDDELSDFEDITDEVNVGINTDNENSGTQIPNKKPSKTSSDYWKGTAKSELNTAPECLKNQPPPLKQSEKHTVTFFLPFQYDSHHKHPPKPHPHNFNDKWNANYVRMPCSEENQLPVFSQTKTVVRRRWDIIQKALTSKITGPFELSAAIMTYNHRYKTFDSLHHFFRKYVDTEERNEFFNNTLKKMVQLALKLPHLCTKPIPLLKKKEDRSITMSQEQVACLLANAFFCTFPRRNTKSRKAEFSSYPQINFNSLFEGEPTNRKMQKLKCIIHYFKRVTMLMPLGVITYRRQVVNELPTWEKLNHSLTRLHVTSGGTIEDDGKGMLQVDFANKFIGGGVLRHGCVQEEIRFLICPEMILSCLFTEVLTENECLIMLGCEQFSKYSGYGDTFEWAGNHDDETCRDINGHLCTEVVAIDAMVIRNYNLQFEDSRVRRELNKAYCGFVSQSKEADLPAVCTGNWGCGAFGGDKRLKALIQLMAAAVAGRDVCYLTFDDDILVDELYELHKYLTTKGHDIASVVELIHKYYTKVCRKLGKPVVNLFDYIIGHLEGNIVEEDNENSHAEPMDCDSAQCGQNQTEESAELNQDDNFEEIDPPTPESTDYKANTP